MAPKNRSQGRAHAQAPVCVVCAKNESKYRCSACPVRYCSVACYKEHKAQHEASTSTAQAESAEAAPAATTVTTTSKESEFEDGVGPSRHTLDELGVRPSQAGVQGEETGGTAQDQDQAMDLDRPSSKNAEGEEAGRNKSGSESDSELRPLSSLLWPPEPDESIFTDPLKKEDPKPLRREELLRIATSPSLRTLLSTTSLPQILSILDTLPPTARHTTLSKLLGLDSASLSKPGGTAASFLSGRESPPPLEDLLYSFSKAARGAGDDDLGSVGGADGEGGGWWLRTYAANHRHYNNQNNNRIFNTSASARGRGNTLPDADTNSNTEQEGEKIWIGPKEKEIVRLFARSVCAAIDGTAEGGGASDPAWGSGGLEWQV